MKFPETSLKPYITPITMHGMDGRMLSLPAKKKKSREILMIYGQHASIERMEGVMHDLSNYGNVTMPDLPGIGGMDSFYKIGQKPTLDNMADYLAAFVKMRFKRKRLTIIGMSFGFIVVVRMLQRNPEIAKKVDLLISMVGFAHYQDFVFSPWAYRGLYALAAVMSNRVPAFLFQKILLSPPVIWSTYTLMAKRHSKMKDADDVERKRRIKFETHLWKINDFRTQMDNTLTMLNLDLCSQRIDMPVYHIAVEPDRYFDNETVRQHLHVIFTDVKVVYSTVLGHAPTVVATPEDAKPFIPPAIRRLLAKKP